MILCKLILRSEEQYDYKFGFYLSAVVTSSISSTVALRCITNLIITTSGFGN
jgi:hypothetical protein